ncbi:hypothetical protein LTR28_004453 [Elasticomyces elasticus]|nr:hypothetical protein LTR50_000385 [Elasticomyces elasticus]KAK5008087.1 hypothetical protein LTR28_004453 [Elasticomyces elasticus]
MDQPCHIRSTLLELHYLGATGSVVSAAVAAGEAIARSCEGLDKKDHDKEAAWTQSFVGQMRAKYPD